MPKTISLDQINSEAESRGGLMRTVEIRQVNEEDRTVELAFSSEYPVERWFGSEILDHSPGAMRTERLETGCPLLVNHNPNDQVGIVQSASLDKDRRGRAVVRFGKSERASEVFTDIKDGIRKSVSFRYVIHEMVVTERKGQPDEVRIVDWEPLEISIVSVPADPSVGVGRTMNVYADEAKREDTKMPKEITPAEEKRTEPKSVQLSPEVQVTADNERQVGEAAAMKRVNEILDMGREYDAGELAAQAIKDGKSPEQFQRDLLKHVDGRSKKPLEDVDTENPDIGMSDREVGQYSFMRAIRALSDPTNRRVQDSAKFEFECSAAAQERMGKDDVDGLIVPSDVLKAPFGSRAINTGTGAVNPGDTGGNIVGTELRPQSFIDILRARSILLPMATRLGDLVGNVDIPKQIASAAGYWIGEDEDAPEDGLELGQVTLSPKTVAARVEITRRLLKQSTPDIEALVRADIAAGIALTIDKAGFYGTGIGNEPRGIVNTTGVNVVDLAAAGQPTYAEVVQCETEIAGDDADVNSMKYCLSAAMRGNLKTTQKFAGTNGAPVWEEGNTVNGYAAATSNQVLAGDLIFGNFADLLIGMWGGLELTADPYTHSAKGRLRIVAMQDVDFVLRRAESFCLGRLIP